MAENERLTIDAFTRGYLECALWLADPDPGSGEWTEHDDWTIENIDRESLVKAIEVCKDFQETNAEDLEATSAEDSRNGHDFWLTRNGHGAGFWDRGYPNAIGDRLTRMSHAFGEASCYGPETEDNGSCTQDQWDTWDGVIYIYD